MLKSGEIRYQFLIISGSSYLNDEIRCPKKGRCFPENSGSAAVGAQPRDSMEVEGR
jgi:hypothetical protein